MPVRIRTCVPINTNLLLAAAAAVTMAALASCGSQAVRQLTIEDLATYETIPVTIEGRVRETYMTGDTCFYSEWAYGMMDDQMGVEKLVPAYQSNDTIGIVTPYGVVEADVFTLRMYLGAYYSRTFEEANMSIAPLPIQKMIEERGGTISVREYILAPDRTYYARVRYDTAYRELDGTAEQEAVVVPRLELSDIPFHRHRPNHPTTPAYRD